MTGDEATLAVLWNRDIIAHSSVGRLTFAQTTQFAYFDPHLCYRLKTDDFGGNKEGNESILI